MKLGLGPDSVIPKRFYFVYNVFCFGLMHHYRVSGPRSAKKVAPSKEVPIELKHIGNIDVTSKIK